MLEELQGWDWRAAFEYAGEPDASYGSPNVSAVEGAWCQPTLFGREDVIEIYGIDEGEHDGPSWIVAGLLQDGRHFYLEAGCDYTGWDCQAGGSAWVADTRDQLIQFGLTERARERLEL